MFRLTAAIAAVLFVVSSWLSGDVIPRFTHSAADYLLMPLLGYLVIIAAAQWSARLLPKAE